MTAALIWIAAVACILAGFAGVVLPALPGAPLLFVGLLLAAWAEGFAYVGAGMLAVLALLAALTYVVDFAAGAVGARRFGASSRAVVGAALGGLVGIFFGIPGIVLGPFAGAVAGELSRGAASVTPGAPAWAPRWGWCSAWRASSRWPSR